MSSNIEHKTPYFWYVLLFFAVTICFIIPASLFIVLIYEENIYEALEKKDSKIVKKNSDEKPAKVITEIKKEEKKEPLPEKKEPLKKVTKENIEPKIAGNTSHKSIIKYSQNPKKMLEFEFDASSSKDKENSIDELKINWDFDNDGKWDSNDKKKSYTFTNAGIYIVNLEVIDKQGLSDKSSIRISNFVPDIMLSTHEKVSREVSQCSQCHYPFSAKSPCSHSEINSNCMDCHKFQEK